MDFFPSIEYCCNWHVSRKMCPKWRLDLLHIRASFMKSWTENCICLFGFKMAIKSFDIWRCHEIWIYWQKQKINHSRFVSQLVLNSLIEILEPSSLNSSDFLASKEVARHRKQWRSVSILSQITIDVAPNSREFAWVFLEFHKRKNDQTNRRTNKQTNNEVALKYHRSSEKSWLFVSYCWVKLTTFEWTLGRRSFLSKKDAKYVFFSWFNL